MASAGSVVLQFTEYLLSDIAVVFFMLHFSNHVGNRSLCE